MVYDTIADWEDIDFARVIFYPRALFFVERAFGEWVLRQGTSWRELIVEKGFGFPAQSVHVDYVAPIRLHERLEVRLTIEDLTPRGFRLAFKILRKENQTLCCHGYVKRRFIQTEAFKGIELPEPFYGLFQKMASEDYR